MADEQEETVSSLTDNQMEDQRMRINVPRQRYPYCVVWTPIPVLTLVDQLYCRFNCLKNIIFQIIFRPKHTCLFFRWLFPIIGHMGIATSAGVIRDFAGPYYVSVSYNLYYLLTKSSLKQSMFVKTP